MHTQMPSIILDTPFTSRMAGDVSDRKLSALDSVRNALMNQLG
jgi:hypothetical protein